MITDKEIEMLEACKSSEDWNLACDAIKAAHDGYPADWYSRVKRSGLRARVLA